jgi:hypothetical protein
MITIVTDHDTSLPCISNTVESNDSMLYLEVNEMVCVRTDNDQTEKQINACVYQREI